MQRPCWILRSSAGHFSRPRRSSAKPGAYHRRPLFKRMNRTGTHQSIRSRTVPRATDTARSISPSRCSSWKKVGMNSAMVCIVTLPCIASTAGMPASARRGPSAARAPPSSDRASSSPPARPALWQEAKTTNRGRCRISPSRATNSSPGTTSTLPSASSSHRCGLPLSSAPWQVR